MRPAFHPTANLASTSVRKITINIIQSRLPTVLISVWFQLVSTISKSISRPQDLLFNTDTSTLVTVTITTKELTDVGWGDVGGGRGSAIETWILERKLGNQNGHDRMKLVDSAVVLRSTGTLNDRITFLVALFGVKTSEIFMVWVWVWVWVGVGVRGGRKQHISLPYPDHPHKPCKYSFPISLKGKQLAFQFNFTFNSLVLSLLLLFWCLHR